MSERERWWLEAAFSAWGAIGLASFFAVIAFGQNWPRWAQFGSIVLTYSWYGAQRYREYRATPSKDMGDMPGRKR